MQLPFGFQEAEKPKEIIKPIQITYKHKTKYAIRVTCNDGIIEINIYDNCKGYGFCCLTRERAIEIIQSFCNKGDIRYLHDQTNLNIGLREVINKNIYGD